MQSLKQEVNDLKSKKSELDVRIKALAEEVALLKGEKDAHTAERDSLAAQIAELKARWDMLYQVAESEPAFRAYFVVADKTHWFPLRHLSSALGIPTSRLKTELQGFIDAGLIEIENDRVRPKNLTDVAKKVAGLTEEAVEAAQAELDESEDADSLPTESNDDNENID